jgi:hypothetical protein
MKNHNTTCFNETCQLCNGCNKQPAFNDVADDFDEWTWQDLDLTSKAEDYVSLDRAIEVATLAG